MCAARPERDKSRMSLCFSCAWRPEKVRRLTLFAQGKLVLYVYFASATIRTVDFCRRPYPCVSKVASLHITDHPGMRERTDCEARRAGTRKRD